jgi:predicted deacylase
MQIQQHPLKSATLGTARHITSFHFGPGNTGRKVYIQSALHADEPPGLLVSHYLRQRLTALEGLLKAEVVLVPVSNPMGLNQWVSRSHVGRFELATGENFNRLYADIATAVGDAVAPLLTADELLNAALVRRAMVAELTRGFDAAASELESMRMTLLRLAIDAEIVLDLHCDSEALLHLYTGSPLWPRVEPLARYMGAAATLLETESGDRPFDEACSRTWWLLRERFGDAHPLPLGCVSVTVELRGTADVTHEYAMQDADAIIAYLHQQGMIDGEAPPQPALVNEATPLAGSAAIETPVSGAVVFLKPLGVHVQKNEPLVDVIDPLTGETHTLLSTTDGVLYARENRRFAHAGMRLCKVAGKVAFRSGKLLSA